MQTQQTPFLIVINSSSRALEVFPSDTAEERTAFLRHVESIGRPFTQDEKKFTSKIMDGDLSMFKATSTIPSISLGGNSVYLGYLNGKK